jgi:hypothetical protein
MAYFDRKDDYGYVRWADHVRRRDHYTCAICGRRGVVVNAHHLNAWANFPDERYDVENGVTLCIFHHEDFHEKYGKGKNTKEQFEEYRGIAEELLKVANEDAIIEVTVKKMLQQAERDKVVREIEQDLERKYGSNRNTSEASTESEAGNKTDNDGYCE